MDKLSLSSGPNREIVRVCDNDFYHKSGDCVVVVGETMFKVHRYRLASDGSAFGDMFSLPNGENVPNSTTENEPLILQDSLDEFRALCWALYALPLEIGAQNNITSFLPNFKRVLHLFSISHKYHFESLETWAKWLLVHHCTSCANTDGKNPVLDSPSCKTSDLELMLRLATRTNLGALSEAAENALMCRLKGFVISPPLSRLLMLAEELGMRKFQGRLYYHELVRQELHTSTMQSSTAYPLFSINLTEKQCLALFRGYWSLSRYWKAFPQTILSKPLPPFTPCAGHSNCQAEWRNIWSVANFTQKVDFPSHSFGPLEKLENVLSSTKTSAFSGLAISSMTQCGLNELKQIIKQLRDTLGDHFLGPHA